MSDDERPPSPTRRTELFDPTTFPLPPLDTSVQYKADAPNSSAWEHFALFLTLASEITEQLMDSDDLPFTNFLRNLQDHDIGLFSEATEYIGRGRTFSVRRSTMKEHRAVVFKSTVPETDFRGTVAEGLRLSAILLELRVLTHPPLLMHPNIVTLLQVGWEGDPFNEFRKWPVLVVEYAELGTLQDFFDCDPTTPLATKMSICQDVTNGLQALHECQVVHGDLKLLNILMFAGDARHPVVAKLSDFGGALPDIPNLTSLQFGTPPWNAPGGNCERPREELLNSDVYSLGMVIWHVMLNGRSPFHDTELFQLPDPLNKEAWRNAMESEKLNDSLFLWKANASIATVGDIDKDLLSNIFDASLRLSPEKRDIKTIAKLLNCSER